MFQFFNCISYKRSIQILSLALLCMKNIYKFFTRCNARTILLVQEKKRRKQLLAKYVEKIHIQLHSWDLGVVFFFILFFTEGVHSNASLCGYAVNLATEWCCSLLARMLVSLLLYIYCIAIQQYFIAVPMQLSKQDICTSSAPGLDFYRFDRTVNLYHSRPGIMYTHRHKLWRQPWAYLVVDGRPAAQPWRPGLKFPLFQASSCSTRVHVCSVSILNLG